MTKENLRRELLARRQALSREEVERASRAVLAELRGSVDWASLGSVHVYRSEAGWKEIDTAQLVAWLEAEWPRIEIEQPSLRRDQPLPDEPFGLVLVPVLGFDGDGNRLGLGGGWYDRFLARQPQALKIGLAYAWALVEEGIPAEPHDVRLDRVVSG
ncbi:MAG TPA: 5-formyltetrahydrofolate cyclo-ligase [Gaiellaceae bacterium]|nr:5-formyltetrahydrofolate cyclo-ligase [Gaiellaceae bacterium]